MKSIYMYFDLVDANIELTTDCNHLHFNQNHKKQNKSRLKRRHYEKAYI